MRPSCSPCSPPRLSSIAISLDVFCLSCGFLLLQYYCTIRCGLQNVRSIQDLFTDSLQPESVPDALCEGIVSPTISFVYLRLSTIMYSGSTSGDTTCRCGKGGHISKVTTPSALPKLLCIQVWKTPGRYGTTL